MAFGLRFDKPKLLRNAEKFVIQGKLPAAIEEYQKILKKDPKDLMTLNTLGDLYYRVGDTREAMQCFQTLAAKSVDAGMLPRAIAIYKRITKIDPKSPEAILKIAELSAMQGLSRDARLYYLQAVEILIRNKDKQQARDIFEKILLLDPENPKLQFQMAELYADTGKAPEAVATYLGASRRFLESRQIAEAARCLDVLLKLDPVNLEAKILFARTYLAKQDWAVAIEMLTAIRGMGEHKEALEALFDAYRGQGNRKKASETASALFHNHKDFTALAAIAADVLAQGEIAGAWTIYESAAPRLTELNEAPLLLEGLRKILALAPSHIGVLELMVKLQRQSGSGGEAQEATELLAHAFVANGELEKARDMYVALVAMEPENLDHRRLLRQVETRLGAAPSQADELSPISADVLASADIPKEELPPREQAIVSKSLTDSDLYLTYHQIPRAIETLEKGLEEVPGNVALLEHLLPLYEQLQHFAKAASCAVALTEAYVKSGDGARASRYGELTLTLQEKASVTPVPEPVSQAIPIDAYGAEAVGAQEGSQVREVDLSMEWTAVPSADQMMAGALTPESFGEEIEFYLQAGLNTDAIATLTRFQEQFPSNPAIAGFRQRLSEVTGEEIVLAASARPEAPVTETRPQESAPLELVTEIALPKIGAEAPIPFAAHKESAPALFAPPLDDFAQPASTVSAFELYLDETQPAEAVTGPPPEPPVNPLAALVQDLESSLSVSPEPERAQPAPIISRAPQDSSSIHVVDSAPPNSRSLLDEIFEEFKQEMEDQPASSGDIETHYNMGVAFKEMALLEEAIGEFQKVQELAERTKDYSYAVQCCSLLASCFLEKGMPQLAVKWYQTALESPGVASESSLALLFEMGAAYETAGDQKAALRSFMEVYARNIDYRNVADRIRELQQSA